jgi:hypothetical protein
METHYTNDVAQLSRYARSFFESSFVKEKIKQAGYSDSYSSILSSALRVTLRGSSPH